MVTALEGGGVGARVTVPLRPPTLERIKMEVNKVSSGEAVEPQPQPTQGGLKEERQGGLTPLIQSGPKVEVARAGINHIEPGQQKRKKTRGKRA